MKTKALALLLVVAACVSTQSGRYVQYSGAVTVTATQTAAALRAGVIDVDTARKISVALKVADAALDAYAVAIANGSPAEVRAAASDARRAKGEARGPMDGIPVAVKDLFCTEGVLTTAGSHILDGYVPAFESTVTRNLAEEFGRGHVCTPGTILYLVCRLLLVKKIPY